MSLCEYKILKRVKEDDGEKLMLNENFAKYVFALSLIAAIGSIA